MYRAQHFGWTPARTAVAMNEINERKDASKKEKKQTNKESLGRQFRQKLAAWHSVDTQHNVIKAPFLPPTRLNEGKLKFHKMVLLVVR